MIEINRENSITIDEFISVLRSSTLAERRPVDNKNTISEMIKNANLIITARDDDKLIGVARSVTDFSYCCYLSDLSVDIAYQRKGIGKKLIDKTMEFLLPSANLILLSAPKAVEYYPKVGFKKHPAAFIKSKQN